jgi:hypothetical protein
VSRLRTQRVRGLGGGRVKYLLVPGRFWWDFIIGRLAPCGRVVAGLGVAALLAHRDVAAWWVMPVAVVLTLAWSLRRATR